MYIVGVQMRSDTVRCPYCGMKMGRMRSKTGLLDGRHSRSRIWVLTNMDFTPKLFLRDIRGSEANGNHAALILTRHPDTPPVDVILEAGLLARGSQHSILPSQDTSVSVAMSNERSPLTVAGAASASAQNKGSGPHRIPS